MADEYLKFKIDDLKDFISSKEELKCIKLYEKTVEVIGIVESVELKSGLFKFILTNFDEDKIQILVREPLISTVQNIVSANSIIHIDGAFAKSRNFSLSNGTIDYDLTVMSNTVINRLGTVNKISNENIETSAPLVLIEDCLNHSGVIEIVAFMKNCIKKISLPNVFINQGCICSDEYKLEIRMPSVIDMSNFKVGMHVRVRGIIKKGQCPYLLLQSEKDIKIESDKILNLCILLKATKMPLMEKADIYASKRLKKEP